MQAQLHLIPGGESSENPGTTKTTSTKTASTGTVSMSAGSRPHEPWRRDESWRLDDKTCEIGRRGIAKAREALLQARNERPEAWRDAV